MPKNQSKEDGWLNALYMYLRLGKGYKLRKTTHGRTFDTGKSRITLTVSPFSDYNIKVNDIVSAKDLGSDYIIAIAPKTPHTHEDVIGFKTNELISFIKKQGDYKKINVGDEYFLKISYDNVCDFASFMLTLH